MSHPWARREAESNVAWEAFIVYRDLGAKRTINRTAEKYGKSASTVGLWSSRHEWMMRAACFDNHEDEYRRAVMAKEQEHELKKIARSQVAGTRAMMSALALPIKAIIEDITKGGAEKFRTELRSMHAREKANLIAKLVGVWPALVKIERLATGQSTENIEGYLRIEMVQSMFAQIAQIAVRHIPEDGQEAFLADVEQAAMQSGLSVA